MSLPQTVQRCERCGNEHAEGASSIECTACGGLLELVHRVTVDAAALKARFDARLSRVLQPDVPPVSPERSGVWRYRELVLPSATDAEIVSHPEGNTPLLVRRVVSDWTGVDGLLMKHEGHNPTGSFKDRGMTAAVTQARRIGARAVACASTGNTSASLAAYAALAGLPALVIVPKGQVAMGKLAQTLAYGARTLLVDGDFDTTLALLRAAGESLGLYLVNSVNAFRIEGQKAIAFELLHQLAWDPPDWIVLPAGNLGNTAALGKALVEAKRIGLIGRLPRIAAVQAAGAAPFATSFANRFRTHEPVRAETVATAIRIGDPASWSRGVRAIRDTDGVVLAVTDDEILEAKAVVDAAGAGCEPGSAAAVAGVRSLIRGGTINPGDRVVAILTGHILKDPAILLDYHAAPGRPHSRANVPVEIPASLAAVEAELVRLVRR
ncbi:MAG: threonine synthase [Gemmatimonadaceae bacterium]|nr:threonine synthase [Gemmatimonadaceae bacterium]